jgi:hypothetical protein
MLPAGKINETDTACLRWYLRQPGETAAQKASINRQSLMGITRRETQDTYENRVLKDFLDRCHKESMRYLISEVGSNDSYKESKRAKKIRSYSFLCSELLRKPLFNEVNYPGPGIRPNYVLQNDYRYRQVFTLYRRLLKKEDEEDRLWDWQSRTFADIARLLVCRALMTKVSEKNGLKALYKSSLNLTKEQQLGCRIESGCEPGPFIVQSPTDQSKIAVLEIVNPDLATMHPVVSQLGRTGGHLYLVFNELNNERPVIIIIWAVHTAGSKDHPPWNDIACSAKKALDRMRLLIKDRKENPPKLYGIVIASDLESNESNASSGDDSQVPLVRIPSSQTAWNDANEYLVMSIEEAMKRML